MRPSGPTAAQPGRGRSLIPGETRGLLCGLSILALITNISGTHVSVEHQGEQTTALLFERESLDEDWAEEVDGWLETAEDEEEDDDLVLIGLHPIDDDTQVERLLYYRESAGPTGTVFSLDVDGTAVSGTLTPWKTNSDAFSPKKK